VAAGGKDRGKTPGEAPPGGRPKPPRWAGRGHEVGETGTVAGIITVEEPGDQRLADYVGLTDVRLRTSMEEARGLFVAEGEKVIRRAAAAGYRLRSLLVTRERLAALADLAAACPGPVYVVPERVAEQLTGYRVHRGALASVARRPLPGVGEVLAAARRVVVLEDLVDHGNVGGIFRCAAALGTDAVLLSPRCADPLYRRAIKVSMGAVFAIPYARMTDWRLGLAGIRAAGFRVLALTPDQSAAPMTGALGGGRVALLLGTEGDGLSSRWLDQADQAVHIPMSPAAMAHGVDSLNVVAAAAIACHELRRLAVDPLSAAAAGVEERGGVRPVEQHDRTQADEPDDQCHAPRAPGLRPGEAQQQEHCVQCEEDGR
jgi:tRNA G18 (ribose-2'-O)-methylase SpoU